MPYGKFTPKSTGCISFRCVKSLLSRDSSVVTGWMIGGSRPGRGWEFFSSPPRPYRLWGLSSLLSNGYQGLFPCGVKRQGHEANHSLPSSAEVKNAWSYTFTPPIRLHGVVPQGQLYIYLYLNFYNS